MDQGRSLLNTLFDRGDPPAQSTLDSRPLQGQPIPNTNITNNQYINPLVHQNSSPPASPLSSATANSGGSNLNEGRQNLLSLLNNAVPNPTVTREPQTRQQELPSPPIQGSGVGNPQTNEASGKLLLEQLMSEWVCSFHLSSNHLTIMQQSRPASRSKRKPDNHI
jgi:hypothetical protein